MSYLDPSVLDRGLFSVAARATRLLITAAEHVWGAPVIGEAVPIVVGPQNATDGRKVTVTLAAAGEVLAAGTAAHWALVDDAGELLLAAAPLDNPLIVEAGNSFSLQPFDIVMPGLA